MQISNELKSHFLRLYQMAITDDNFSPLELKMLYRFAKERDIPSNELDKILLTASEEFAIPETLEKRIEYLYDFALMIWADKKVTNDEVITLMKYCKKFEFLDENIEDLAKYLIDCAQKDLSKEAIIHQINR
jgi:hypothetical protein